MFLLLAFYFVLALHLSLVMHIAGTLKAKKKRTSKIFVAIKLDAFLCVPKMEFDS